jgi:TonB family protein
MQFPAPTLAALIAALSVVAPSQAAPIAFDGVDQHDRGHTKAAIRDLERLAEDGDTRAQYNYGVELIKGASVAQDLVGGYAWLEIAADCAATCSSAELSAQARDARLRLQHHLDGPQLLQAERIAESYLAPRRARHEQSLRDVGQALRGQSVDGIAVHAGCAAEALEGCDVAPHRARGRTSCTGIVAHPDRLAADRGPQAQIRPPKYPAAARKELAEGRVVIGAHVDYTGFVCNAAVIRSSGSAAIDRAALDSLVTWRFQPAVLQNQAVDSLFNMTLDFSFVERWAP